MSFQKFIFKISIIIFSISLIYFINFAACELNTTNELLQTLVREPRITGGYRPKQQSLAKYVVSLRYREISDKYFGYNHICAGSIIAREKILTAAHCLFVQGKQISPLNLKVVAKTPKRLNKTLFTQEINVVNILVHSKYKDKSLFNDIAILILEKEIELDSEYAAVIELPKINYKTDMLCQVIGWGRLYMYGPLANEILQVDLHLHSRQYCRKTFPPFSGKKICAFNIYDREKDACSGDSGGPMICQGVLTGIVSYGMGCPSGRASVYTNVFRYLDWISDSGQLPSPSLFVIVFSLLFKRALNFK